MKWEGEALERAHSLYVYDGLSASVVARILTEEFSEPVTRNMIIGIASRRGWRKGEHKKRINRLSWPPQVVNEVRRLYADECIPTEIVIQHVSDMLGREVAYDAFRYHLARHGIRRPENFVHGRKSRKWNALQSDASPEVEEPRITDIMELQRHHCRWPVGEPGKEGFGWCGEKAVEGLPYCHRHCARAYYS